MMLKHYLRPFRPDEIKINSLLSIYPGSRIVDVAHDKRYIKITLVNADGDEAEGLLDIDRWLTTMSEYIPALPWDEISINYLITFLNDWNLRFILNGNIWDTRSISLPYDGFASQLVELPADPVPLLNLKGFDVENNKKNHHYWILNNIKYEATFHLGSSSVKLADINHIQCGDLLIISNQNYHLYLNGKKKFKFTTSDFKEIIVEELHNHYIDEDEYSVSPQLELEDGEELKLKNVPIEIQFLLDKKMVDLGFILNKKPGDIIELNTSAEKNISLYVNKSLFAKGELVVVEDKGLAVEIHTIVNNILS